MKLKFIVILLASNGLTYTLVNPQKNIQAKKSNKIRARDGYHFLELPIRSFVKKSEHLKDIEVSLFSESKKLLIPKAYLRNKKTSPSNYSQEDLFLIEIPKKYVSRIINQSHAYFLAFPPVGLNKTKLSQRRNFEIIF